MSVDAGGAVEIVCDEASIEEMSSDLQTASTNFQRHTLSPIDSVSTITANEKSREAHGDTQNGHATFAQAILNAAIMIKDAADTFNRVDSQQTFVPTAGTHWPASS